MIKWKYNKKQTKEISQIMDLQNCEFSEIYLDELEDDKVYLYGLLLLTRKLKVNWSLEKAHPICFKGFEEELTEAMSIEMANNVDAEIIKTLSEWTKLNAKD